MLKNMRDPGVIRGFRSECQVKHPVSIIVGNIIQFCPCLLVHEAYYGSIYLRKIAYFECFKTIYHLPYFRKGIIIRRSSGFSCRITLSCFIGRRLFLRPAAKQQCGRQDS